MGREFKAGIWIKKYNVKDQKKNMMKKRKRKDQKRSVFESSGPLGRWSPGPLVPSSLLL